MNRLNRVKAHTCDPIKPIVRYSVNQWSGTQKNFALVSMHQETLLPILFQLFRQYGYEGVSLSKISAATTLGKASLYHHFPGGKAEMLTATLSYSQQWFDKNILQVLASDGEAVDRLQQMCDRLNELYGAGEQPCLLATLTVGPARSVFHETVKLRLERFIAAIARLLYESGVPKALAQQRAEDAIIALQGALILSRGLDSPAPFKRVIAQLPQKLCAQVSV